MGKEGGAEAIELSLWADRKQQCVLPKRNGPVQKVSVHHRKPTAEERAAREEKRKERLANHLSAKNLHGHADPSVWDPLQLPTAAKASPRNIYLSRPTELREIERAAVKEEVKKPAVSRAWYFAKLTVGLT